MGNVRIYWQEKSKIKRITRILLSIHLPERYCQQFKDISKRRKEKKNLKNGKKNN